MLSFLLEATVSTILHVARNEKSTENRERVQINNSRPEALPSLIMLIFVKMTAGTLDPLQISCRTITLFSFFSLSFLQLH